MMDLLQPARSPHARHIGSLTSLRFLAAAWVLALHFTDNLSADGLIDGATLLFERGGLGVDFFFILSGFILTHAYIDALRTGRFGYGLFLRRRLARIYPLHFVTFLLSVCYVVAGRMMGIEFSYPEAYALSEIPFNLLLMHGWGFGRLSWNYVSWSLSAEWFAYLMFPLLSWLVMRPRWGPMVRLAAAVGLLVLVYLLAPLVFGRTLTDLTNFSIPRILPEFLLGVALYHVSLAYDLNSRVVVPLVFGGVIVLLLATHFGLSDLFAILTLGFLIFATASLERQGRGGWLTHRWFVYLGEISYSVYMVHAIVLTVYFKGLAILLGSSYATFEYVLAPGAIVIALVAASIAYHLVEVPGRAFFGRADFAAGWRNLRPGRSRRPGGTL